MLKMKKCKISFRLVCLLAIAIFMLGQSTFADSKSPDFQLISSMEDGWQNMYQIGDFQYDFRDAAEGRGSLVLIPDNRDGFAGIQAMCQPTNLLYNGIRFYVKSDHWESVSTLGVAFHTYNDWQDYYIVDAVGNLFNKPNNEWIEVILSPSAFTKTGNPTWQSISKITFRLDVSPGQSCQVKIDGLESFFSVNPSAVSIVFDDGQLEAYRAKSIMDEAGVAGTLFVIPELLGEPGFLNQYWIDFFHASGWDIGGHNWQVLPDLSPEELHQVFKATKDYLTTHQYKGRDLYAIPYGLYNKQVIEIGSQYFTWLRPNDNMNQPSGYISPCRINSRIVSQFTPVEEVLHWIDLAKENNDWLILVFHRIVDRCEYDTDYTEKDFQEIIQYSQKKDIDILPMSDYLKQYNQH